MPQTNEENKTFFNPLNDTQLLLKPTVRFGPEMMEDASVSEDQRRNMMNFFGMQKSDVKSTNKSIGKAYNIMSNEKKTNVLDTSKSISTNQNEKTKVCNSIFIIKL